MHLLIILVIVFVEGQMQPSLAGWFLAFWQQRQFYVQAAHLAHNSHLEDL
jgi:hypothetical protein